MIVPMKKAVLFVMKRDEETALRKLKSLGVLHIDTIRRESTPLAACVRDRETLEKALRLLPAKKARRRRPRTAPGGTERPSGIREQALAVVTAAERLSAVEEECRRLEDEIGRFAPWGDFDPEALKRLEAKGVHVGLYELSRKDLTDVPPGLYLFPVNRFQGATLAAAVSFQEEIRLPLKPVKLPPESLRRLEHRLMEKREEKKRLGNALLGMAAWETDLAREQVRAAEAVEFEEARVSFEAQTEILYLQGYVPAPEAADLKAAARAEGWGVMVNDPGPEDDVPVLVRRPKPLRIIQPVFDFLGTVPGYKEYDISLPFLAFFSIFIAMLIGDAGYGLLFIGLSVLGRLVLKKIPPALFGLLLLTSAATVVWGALTGTWFGSEALAQAPVLKDLMVAEIATFSKTDNRTLMMLICFIIGLVHLSLAHIISAVRNRKAFKGLAEIGRLALAWGMFLMVLYLVLHYPFQPISIWLLGGGLGFVVLFEQQRPAAGTGPAKKVLGFAAGVGRGLANLFTTILSAVSSLADIISYVRLFAVGLAGVEIAKTFNNMASSLGGGGGVLGIVVSVLILFVGHALNMVLSLMSVLVHGVRLNMLEFSGHLGMEWSGREYRPFADRSQEKYRPATSAEARG